MYVLVMQGKGNTPEKMLIEKWGDENDRKFAEERCKVYNASEHKDPYWMKARVLPLASWVPVEKPNEFYWDDIVYLDDRAIQVVLRETDASDLATALVGSELRIKQKLLRNFSKRAAHMLLEDIAYMGPVQKSKIERCRKKFEETVNKCITENRIIFDTVDELVIDTDTIEIDDYFPVSNSEKNFVHSDTKIEKQYNKWKQTFDEINGLGE